MRYIIIFLTACFLFACTKKEEPAPAVELVCKLPELKEHPFIGVGFPRAVARVASSGKVKVTVIFVDFSDAPASRTPEDVFGIISPASETLLSAVSYGKLSLSFDPKFKWFRMSKPSASYDRTTYDNHRIYLQEAISLADPSVDFSGSDAFLVIANPDAGNITRGYAFETNALDGIVADAKYLNNGSSSGSELLTVKDLWFPHEFGHNMGLVDTYAYDGLANRFMGDFSVMANTTGTAPEHTGWERWLLGWIDDSQVTCSNSLGKKGTVILTPIENKDGQKLLVIPYDNYNAIVVESRRATGYDKLLAKEGPLVYMVDTRMASGMGPIRVLPINDNDTQKRQAVMTVNQSLPAGPVTITYISRDAAGDHIQYEIK